MLVGFNHKTNLKVRKAAESNHSAEDIALAHGIEVIKKKKLRTTNKYNRGCKLEAVLIDDRFPKNLRVRV